MDEKKSGGPTIAPWGTPEMLLCFSLNISLVL